MLDLTAAVGTHRSPLIAASKPLLLNFCRALPQFKTRHRKLTIAGKTHPQRVDRIRDRRNHHQVEGVS
jgi:hypothetical protein